MDRFPHRSAAYANISATKSRSEKKEAEKWRKKLHAIHEGQI